MGPRLFSRGNYDLSDQTILAQFRFNGAATLQPRKYDNSKAPRHGRVQLQWGRDSSAAEMRMEQILKDAETGLL